MGGRIRPPALNVLSKEKVPKSRRRRGPKGSSHITKSAQNNYLGLAKKFENNRLSHFLTVLAQKFGGPIRPPHS